MTSQTTNQLRDVGSSYLTGMVVIQLSTLGGGLSQELLSLFHLVVLVHSIHCMLSMLHFKRHIWPWDGSKPTLAAWYIGGKWMLIPSKHDNYEVLTHLHIRIT